MAKKPTTADAQLIVQLYDLRREAEMRKARNWWAGEFFPQSADDFLKVAWARGTPENAWLRQVGGYWGMVCSFVLNGALNEELFLAPGFSGELFLIYAKIHPYLKELREKLNDLPRDKDILAFCKLSMRGYEAQRILNAAGFDRVSFIEGGLTAWPFEVAKIEQKVNLRIR